MGAELKLVVDLLSFLCFSFICLSTEITNYNRTSCYSNKKEFVISLLFRTSGGTSNPTPDTQNGHISLANIATEFLSERKSSSRRQNSIRRKIRGTITGKPTLNAQRPSSNVTSVDETVDQKVVSNNVDVGITTLIVPTITVNNSDNKHQSKMVNIFVYPFPYSFIV